MDRKSAQAMLVVLAVVCTSCDTRRARNQFDDELIESLGDLPGARQTTHAQLRAEIARITSEGGTPKLLMQSDLPPAENVAVGLSELFAVGSLRHLDERAEKLFPLGRFRFNPIVLENVNRFQDQHTVELDRLAAALRRPACNFEINFRRGFFTGTSFVETVRICARFEAFQVAQRLAVDQPIEAILPLQAMFRLIQLMAAERHVEARLAAAALRADALLVLEAIAQHPLTTRSELVALYQIIQDQLRNWPPDADAWIGDRAMTLHSYEVIRIGQVFMLLTSDEMKIFDAEGMLRNMPSALKRTADHDEYYYLQTMRKILESCRQPFYQRKALFLKIREEFYDLKNTEDFPVAAARLFLTDVERGHAIQARDRALTEIWAIALALAAGFDPPNYRVNPYSGKEYQVLKEAAAVSVWTGEDDDGHIIVPYPKTNPQGGPTQNSPAQQTSKQKPPVAPAPRVKAATPREAQLPRPRQPLPIRRPMATPKRQQPLPVPLNQGRKIEPIQRDQPGRSRRPVVHSVRIKP